ncbi:MAG: hypothetical protein ABSH28_05095, partial [Acidobacteriota bacterium]
GRRSRLQAIEAEKNGFRNRQGADLPEIPDRCGCTFRLESKSRGYSKERCKALPDSQAMAREHLRIAPMAETG